MGLETLIFAVDGVVAETHEARRETYNDVFREAGLDWNWDRARYAELLKSTGGDGMIREFASAHLAAWRYPQDLSALIAAMNRRHATLLRERTAGRGVAMRPGVTNFLNAAARSGLRLVISTHEHEDIVWSLLDVELASDVSRMFEIVSMPDKSCSDTLSGLHGTTVEQLGLSPRTCLAVESTARGLKSALAAKLPVVLTWGMYPELQECCDLLLKSDEATLAFVSSVILGRWDCATPAELIEHLQEIHAAQVRNDRRKLEFNADLGSIWDRELQHASFGHFEG
jgi:beta-phosphoglucomutase-like phosphatase (HAD superfamily)